MSKILLVANTGWYLYNFRLPLARELASRGVEVVLVSPHDPYVARMQAEGFRWVPFEVGRRSVNPFRELISLLKLAAIYRREKPQAIHHFTIKPVLYGTLAGKLAQVPKIINAVTGLGHVFLGHGRRAVMARPVVKLLYRLVLGARRSTVIFQNPDDYDAFVGLGLLNPERGTIIRSSGVNTQRFAPRPSQPDEPPTPVVLFASRLLTEKGVEEYVSAARSLRQAGLEAVFQLAGSPDEGNPSSIPLSTLARWEEEGAVDVLGHVEDMPALLQESTLVVLPSYREGTPRILIEAAAMGKPIVATDVPGCREAVSHGENGLLVPVRDAEALALAIRKLLEDPELQRCMGQAGRAKALAEFDERVVIAKTFAVYERIGALTLAVA